MPSLMGFSLLCPPVTLRQCPTFLFRKFGFRSVLAFLTQFYQKRFGQLNLDHPPPFRVFFRSLSRFTLLIGARPPKIFSSFCLGYAPVSFFPLFSSPGLFAYLIDLTSSPPPSHLEDYFSSTSLVISHPCSFFSDN